ncbi:MAG: HAD-IIB family hydrolase [Rhodoferax sp.]|nr:HAD-IIB family hydrolase [Rhodoferax sp.]
MLALSSWPVDARRRIVGVFTDIDDTLTTDGAITADALDALSRLQTAGLPVVAITGRPALWSEAFARSWPIDAIVAENGAVSLARQTAHTPHGEVPVGVQRRYLQDAATRQTNFTRMRRVAQRVLHEVPGAMLSKDSPGRETDIAIDHSEFTELPAPAIERVVAIMRSEGMHASVSSIHVNGWYGEHNKLVGAQWAVRELYGRELHNEMDHWVYVGDSTNDQVMFAAFANSVGVANIRRFLPDLVNLPRYVTARERGAGFAEVAAAVLAARGGRS